MSTNTAWRPCYAISYVIYIMHYCRYCLWYLFTTRHSVLTRPAKSIPFSFKGQVNSPGQLLNIADKLFISTRLGRSLTILHFITCYLRTVPKDSWRLNCGLVTSFIDKYTRASLLALFFVGFIDHSPLCTYTTSKKYSLLSHRPGEVSRIAVN